MKCTKCGMPMTFHAADNEWVCHRTHVVDRVHTALPVHGYTAQSDSRVELVNENKVVEERVLRRLDELAALSTTDKRWLAIGRTHIEQAFMAINRSVFQPQRVKLPEDGQ